MVIRDMGVEINKEPKTVVRPEPMIKDGEVVAGKIAVQMQRGAVMIRSMKLMSPANRLYDEDSGRIPRDHPQQHEHPQEHLASPAPTDCQGLLSSVPYIARVGRWSPPNYAYRIGQSDIRFFSVVAEPVIAAPSTNFDALLQQIQFVDGVFGTNYISRHPERAPHCNWLLERDGIVAALGWPICPQWRDLIRWNL
jgi:hypothetical protein